MKLTIKKNLILEALKNVNNIVNVNNLNPILSSVLLKTEDDKLVITATNGTNSYLQTISDIKIKKEGEILVRAKFLYNIISKIEHQEVEINQLDEKLLEVKTTNFSCEINLTEQRSFPIIDFNYQNLTKIILTQDVMINVASKITPFCSIGDTYLTLEGILFKNIDSKNMECISTNKVTASYYCFNYQLQNPTNVNEGDIKFVIAPEAIKIVLEILSSRKIKEFDLYTDDKKCIFKIQDTLLSFVLYENNTYPFPDIVDKLLARQKYSFTVKTHDLLLALQRGCLFVNNEAQPTVKFHIGDKTLDIKFTSCDVGSSFEQITFEDKNIGFLDFSLNPKMLVQIVASINMPEITFNCDNETSPIVISTKNKYFVNLIMPCKL